MRWLDEKGWERLRVDQRGGTISLVETELLQDKSARAYFRDAVSLPDKGIYYSALDLNVEHEQIEVPFRPMLRVATPLLANGARRGVVIINYAAQTLLNRLRHLAGEDPRISLFAVNREGYWIIGPAAAEEWAWQRGRPDFNLATEEPDLWKAMGAERSGEFSAGDTHWAFQRLDLGAGLLAARDASVISGPGTSLSLLIRMDEHQSEEGELQAKVLLSLLALVLMGMVVVIAVRMARALEREATQAEELQLANAALTEANQHLEEAQRDVARAERLSSLGLMVAGVAHELNTPLGVATLSLSRSVDAVTELESRLRAGLRRSDLETYIETDRADLGLAQDALRRCVDLVRRFKQVALDRATVSRRPMDLAETVLDADTRLRKWDKSGGVALICTLEAGVEMDSFPGQLQQVVSNLINNVLKHAFAEGRHGTLSIRARAEGADAVHIEIEDDGAGIAPEVLPKVFEPFFTTARGQGGTGLGLHIVHQIITELLGGRIEVFSPPPGFSHGTLTVVTLPRVAPDVPGASKPCA